MHPTELLPTTTVHSFIGGLQKQTSYTEVTWFYLHYAALSHSHCSVSTISDLMNVYLSLFKRFKCVFFLARCYMCWCWTVSVHWFISWRLLWRCDAMFYRFLNVLNVFFFWHVVTCVGVGLCLCIDSSAEDCCEDVMPCLVREHCELEARQSRVMKEMKCQLLRDILVCTRLGSASYQ